MTIDLTTLDKATRTALLAKRRRDLAKLSITWGRATRVVGKGATNGTA